MSVHLGRARPLPLAIGAMAALFVVKLVALSGAVWQTGSLMLSQAGSAVVPSAYASTPSPQSSSAIAPPASVTQAEPGPMQPVRVASTLEPQVGEAERALLLELRARRAALDAREQAIGGREEIIGAAERRLSARVDELAALQTRLEQLETARRERDDANWRSLVKTYETMRPRDAAAILNDLDMPILLQVLDRMKEAKMAAVLAAMLPDRARAATTQLAQMRTRANSPS